MLLYKYRSLASIELVLDILVNERLYCAPYNRLNDPFEGQFFYQRPKSMSNTAEPERDPYLGKPIPRLSTDIADLVMNDSEHRICSLCRDKSSVQMWSLYGDGHKGVAIELDFSGIEHAAKKVDYKPSLISTAPSLFSDNIDTILTTKTCHWEYEKEYRVIAQCAFFPVSGRIRRILVGQRADPQQIELLQKITGSKYQYERGHLDAESIRVVFPGND